MLDDGDDRKGEEFQGPISDPTDGLGPEIPSVQIPDATTGSGGDSDVPADVAVTFWGLVVTLNFAVFAVSFGPMLAYFRGQIRLGGGLFVLGVLAFAYAYYKYRRYMTRDEGEEGASEADGTTTAEERSDLEEYGEPETDDAEPATD